MVIGLLAVFLFGAVVVGYYLWAHGEGVDLYEELFEEDENDK